MTSCPSLFYGVRFYIVNSVSVLLILWLSTVLCKQYKMTQLGKFLGLGILAILVWIKLIAMSDPDEAYYTYFVLPLPVWGVIVLGAISAAIVLYRTFTFNDCPEAAKELLGQIEEARKDLRQIGMKSL